MSSSPSLQSYELKRALQSALLSLALATTTLGTQAFAADNANTASKQQFNLSPGPLGDVLAEFAAITGTRLSFDPALLTGLNSQGLQGSYTVTEGFNQLLKGSGYGMINQHDDHYTLERLRSPAATNLDTKLPEITVSAKSEQDENRNQSTLKRYVSKQSASSKMQVSLLETPRSISIVTREQMRIQLPKSIEQALAYTSDVLTEIAGPDVRMSGVTIRGFSDGSAYYKDGLKQLAAGTYGSWNDDIDDLESIEVLKGPASVLFGQGRPGGIVNVVSKRPSADHVNAVRVSYGRYNRRQLNADLGGTLDEAGTLMYRVNIIGRESDGRTVGSRDDRISIAPSLRWDISPQTHLTLLGNYSEEKSTPKSWWPSLFVYPQIKDLPVNRTAGDPSFDRFNRNTKSLGYAIEHETDSEWHLSQNFRYSEIDVDYRHIYADSVLSDQRTITRANLAQRTNGKTWAVDSRALKNFSYGEIQHQFVAGVDYIKYKQDDRLGFGWSVPNLDIYAPVYGQSIEYPALDSTESELKQTGLYTLNQFKWNQWIANFSLRHDKTRTEQTSATQPRISDTATTGSAGLMYLFENGVAPYVSYSTAFDPITGRKFDGSAFEPREGKQYEAGLKYQPSGSSNLFTASVFDIRQTNVTTQDTQHPGFSIQTGEVRSTGVELEGKFGLHEDITLLTNYTYLDPRITKSNRAGEVGRQVMQTTRHMASVWVDYRPSWLKGLMLGAGVRYIGRKPYAVSASGELYTNDAYTLADLVAAYETPRYRAALNVNNLFDKKYFAGPFRGIQQEAQLSLTYFF